MKELSEKNGWTYEILDDAFEQDPGVEFKRDQDASTVSIKGSLGLKGIIINVGYGVEPLALLFDRSGILTDIMSQVTWVQNSEKDNRLTFCKTQFGPIEAHISLIETLDILKKKYVTNLEVTDEGEYWMSRDRELLAEKRAVLQHYMNHARETISNARIPPDAGLSAEDTASSIEKALLDAEDNKGPIQ